MAKLKVYTFPDTVLAQKAKPIHRVEKTLFRLADDMLETMYYAPGIGLAANQVGLLDRIIVVDTDYDAQDIEGGMKVPENAEVIANQIITGKNPIVLINPELIYKEGEFTMSEGCLSVPDYNAEVKRFDKIKVQYQDLDGLKKELSAEGLMSVCLQHEIDHLDGKLFIDRLSTLKKEFAKKKLIRIRRFEEGT
jgi:peptide deformylase